MALWSRSTLGSSSFRRKLYRPSLCLVPPLPIDVSHIHVGQLKQMLDMMAVIGLPPAPGYEKYVPQDSLIKRMHDEAHQQGYSVNRSDCSDDNHHINKGNHITRPTLTYLSTVIESVSLQFLANHRDRSVNPTSSPPRVENSLTTWAPSNVGSCTTLTAKLHPWHGSCRHKWKPTSPRYSTSASTLTT